MPPLALQCILKLQNNSKDIYLEASQLLIKIADNILNDPFNMKLRTLKKENTTISNKLLVAAGAIDCLLTMGFKNETSSFVLPLDEPLDMLENIRDELINRSQLLKHKATDISKAGVSNTGAVPKQNNSQNVPSSVVHAKASSSVQENKQTSSEILQPMSRNPFLNKIQQQFNNAREYDNPITKSNALKVIPLEELKEKAVTNLSSLQNISKDKIDQAELQDLLLLELLAWYKDSFFTWVDSPECKFCKGKTQFFNTSTDYSYAPTNRVEVGAIRYIYHKYYFLFRFYKTICFST